MKTRLKRDLNIDFRDTSEKMRPQFAAIEECERVPRMIVRLACCNQPHSRLCDDEES